MHGILDSRIYLGEVVYRGEWFKGHHEPIITAELFARAHRGWVPGKKRLSRHPLSGVVRCGLCGRAAAATSNGKGAWFYRCWHRGQGCGQPSRSVRGIERAALLGLRLVGFDDETCRRRSAGSCAGRPGRAPEGGRPGARRNWRASGTSDASCSTCTTPARSPPTCSPKKRPPSQRRYRHSKRAPRLAGRSNPTARWRPSRTSSGAGDLDIEEIWQEATDDERRILANDLLDGVSFFPDHLEVKVAGAPKMNVTLQEVGLTGGSASYGVGEPSVDSTDPGWRLAQWPANG